MASVDVTRQEAGVRLIVLDGLDEAISRHIQDRDVVRLWLQGLMNTLGHAPLKPRLLLSGRNAALERGMMDPHLTSALQAFCGGRNPLRSPKLAEPKLVRLKRWNGAELWNLLFARVVSNLRRQSHHLPKVVARNLCKRIPEAALTSPLLFKMAYEILVELASDDAPKDSTIQNEWDLVDAWISQMIESEHNKHSHSLSSSECRRAAQEIALALVQSGRGMEGATEAEILDLVKAGRINPALLDNDGHALKFGSLLSSKVLAGAGANPRIPEHTYAPFHEVILIHLAAEALRRRWSSSSAGDGFGGDDDDPSEPGLTKQRKPDPGNIPDMLASMMDRFKLLPESPTLFATHQQKADGGIPYGLELSAQKTNTITLSALQADSSFSRTLSYLAQHNPLKTVNLQLLRSPLIIEADLTKKECLDLATSAHRHPIGG